MKRCPACGSISPDSEVTCGACGSSIADVPFESMEQIEAERKADDKREEAKEHKEFERAKVRLVVRDVVGFLAAIAIISAGLYLLLSQSNVYGFFVFVAGVLLLVAVLGTGPFTRGRGWGAVGRRW